jgi:MFS transporter, SHS family, lactate transporter
MVDNSATDKAAEGVPSEQKVEQLHESHAPETMSARRYLATRFSTLKPPMNKAPNPFKLLALLNRRQWAFFFIGFVAWVLEPPPICRNNANITSLGMLSISLLSA